MNSLPSKLFRVYLMVLLAASFGPEAGGQKLEQQVRKVLRRGVEYFRSIATCGGYLWRYSEDLGRRYGEGKATASQIWVQPPGTPAVGFAFLEAYEATQEPLYLIAARDAAQALVWGQLESGGWDYRIDFSAEAPYRWRYRHSAAYMPPSQGRNTSTFDDNNSQSALRFLMAVHQLMDEPWLREAVKYGLAFMLQSQYPNGAWPQRYPPPNNYGGYYTFNDNAINDCIYVMLDAYRYYGRPEYLASAQRGGNFIILSQLPAPQAGWAQQYDFDLKPAWARWFEPPSVCSAVVSRNIRTLITLYLETGEEKYLQPIPAAIAWLEQSKIGENLWARFYELETNRPIYVNLERKVVYEFVNIRPGYSWKGSYGIPGVIALYQKVKQLGREQYLAQQQQPLSAEARRARLRALEPQVRAIVAAQDDHARWVENGWINCSTFIRHLERLSEYLRLLAQGG
ncbi:MAG TPA: hypothetical protein EYP85_09730 [Armatimonadetes bacterium]|nr:hypothetical protein [Armatimonadota bacterium]